VKKQASSSSKVEQFHQFRKEAIAELLRKRKEIERHWALEVAKFEGFLEQNAKELAELGHRVKDTKVNLGGNVRLTDEEIQTNLERILSGGNQRSLPTILKELKIARSRFSEWEKRNPSVVEYRGDGKSRLYFLKSRRR
jgi:hypothetical protein